MHDAGGKVRLTLQPGVRGEAEFSVCERYRYWLSRHWGIDEAPYALWIGMNPSTAQADIDDPTIRKEMHFTRAMGLTGYVKCNIMDYRTTDPKKLLEWGIVPCSNDNFATISRLVKNAFVIVAAWGALPKPLRSSQISVQNILLAQRHQIMCMGMTKDGSPRHPLYLRNDTVPIVWKEK